MYSRFGVIFLRRKPFFPISSYAHAVEYDFQTNSIVTRLVNQMANRCFMMQLSNDLTHCTPIQVGYILFPNMLSYHI